MIEQTSSRYLSPPISPEPKHSQKSSIFDKYSGTVDQKAQPIESLGQDKPSPAPRDDGKDDSDGPRMVILPANTDIKRHKAFLAAYGFHLGAKKKELIKKRNKNEKQRPKNRSLTSSSSSDENSSGFIGKDSVNVPCTQHQYLTRSKKPKILDDADVTSESKIRPNSSKKIFESRRDFYENGTVQEIHDCTISEVPNLIPDISSISSKVFEEALNEANLPQTNTLRERDGLDKVEAKEVQIITAMKLTPLQYLDSKKRLFAEKARKCYHSKTFKKTDAQKACRIDVNKASKLFEVFQNSGLLDDDLFEKVR